MTPPAAAAAAGPLASWRTMLSTISTELAPTHGYVARGDRPVSALKLVRRRVSVEQAGKRVKTSPRTHATQRENEHGIASWLAKLS